MAEGFQRNRIVSEPSFFNSSRKLVDSFLEKHATASQPRPPKENMICSIRKESGVNAILHVHQQERIKITPIHAYWLEIRTRNDVKVSVALCTKLL